MAKKNLKDLFSYLAMGVGGGMSGQDYLGDFLKREAAAAKERAAAPKKLEAEKGKYAESLKTQVEIGVLTPRGAFEAWNEKYGTTTAIPTEQPQPPTVSPQVPIGQPQAPIGGGQALIGQPPAVPMVPKGLSPLQQPTGYKPEPGKEKARTKWDTQVAERSIKFDVLTPKLLDYMEVGGRAYRELRNTAKNFGINLNYERGGLDALIAGATKNIAMKTKLAPLMVALERLRPELGTELMRQLGAFRSAEMAQRFADTLAQFSGDIREDIANMSTTMKKNKANVVLLDESGKRLSNEERAKKMDGFEANLIRKYNFMYRGMGLMTKPYTAQRSLEWLAQNSKFNEGELGIIENAVADNPKYSRTKVIAKLIERGIL